MRIQQCPNEILVMTFANLPLLDLLSCAEVCKDWSALIESTQFSRRSRPSLASEADSALRQLIMRRKRCTQKDMSKARILVKFAGCKQEMGGSLLALAVSWRKPGIARLLLEREDINFNAFLDSSARRAALRLGYKDILVKFWTHPTVRPDENCAIMGMIHFGDGSPDAIRALLKRDNVSAHRPSDGMTPLYCAARMGRLSVCRLLVEEYGADPNAMTWNSTSASMRHRFMSLQLKAMSKSSTTWPHFLQWM